MFFDKLKAACVSAGTSPTALLKSIGMSTSSVTSWKKGVVPSMGTIYKLAEALDIEPAELLESSDQAAHDAYDEGYMDCLTAHQGKKNKPALPKESELNEELVRRLMQLTPDEAKQVDAFVQGLLASR